MPERQIGILLAEDNDDMRFLLKMAFERSRFNVVAIANDGDEAVALWQVHRAEIGAVALDHRMPGASGLEVAQMIRAQDPQVPIVLFSAELTRELKAAADADRIGTLHKDDILDLPNHPAFA